MLIPQVKPPFKPLVKFDTDVSNFDEDFTSEPVKLSPPEGKGIEDKGKPQYPYINSPN